MDFNYTANWQWAKIHEDPNPFIFYRGVVGCGKTSGAVVHTFIKANMQEPNRYGVRQRRTGVVRATAPRLQTTVMQTYEGWFGDVDKGTGILQWKRSSPMSARCTIPSIWNDGTTVEWEIDFLALDREEDVEILKSREFSDIYFCEAMEMKKNIIDAARGRIGRYPPANKGVKCTNKMLLCDYNSPPIDHFLAELEVANPDSHSFYVAPPAVRWVDDKWTLNPDALNLENLDDNYYRDQLYGADDNYINVMLANNFGSLKSERRVFMNYDDNMHAAKSNILPLRGVPLIIGLDAGLTPAAVFCQLSPMGQLLIIDEIVTEDCGMSQFIEEYLKPKILSEYSTFDYKIVVDPAATQRAQTDMTSCYDILRRASLPIETAESNKLVDRFDSVDYFLRRMVDGKPALLVSPRCSIVRKGFLGEYKFAKVVGKERYHSVPEKNFVSHAMDATQYAALNLVSPTNRSRSWRGLASRRINKPASSVAGY